MNILNDNRWKMFFVTGEFARITIYKRMQRFSTFTSSTWFKPFFDN
jgi:hypothetical protein